MSDKGNTNQGESATAYYRRTNERLDELHETMKENIATLPKAREAVANHYAMISSLVDPHTSSQVKGLAANMAVTGARLEARLHSLEEQREELQRKLAEVRCGGNLLTGPR